MYEGITFSLNFCMNVKYNNLNILQDINMIYVIGFIKKTKNIKNVQILKFEYCLYSAPREK